MNLLNGSETQFKRGRYQFAVDCTSAGTVTLAIKLTGGNAFINMTNGSWSANEDGIIELSECEIKVTVTGGALFCLGIVTTGR